MNNVDTVSRTGASATTRRDYQASSGDPGCVGASCDSPGSAGGSGSDSRSSGLGSGSGNGAFATGWLRNAEASRFAAKTASEALIAIGLIWLLAVLVFCSDSKTETVSITECVLHSVEFCPTPPHLSSGSEWLQHGICLAKTAGPCVAIASAGVHPSGQTHSCDVTAVWPEVQSCITDLGCTDQSECQTVAADCWRVACP